MLNDLMPGFIEQLAPMAEERGLALSLDEQAQLWVKAPSRVIQIIVINLLRKPSTTRSRDRWSCASVKTQSASSILALA